MIIIYRSKPSNSARELVETLANCRRGRDFTRRPARNGDKIVCWGESLSLPGFEVLNGSKLINKFEAAVKLKAAAVPTIEVTRNRPRNTEGTPAQPALFENWPTGRLTKDQVRIKVQELNQWLQTARDIPATTGVEWLGRTNNHVGGADLLFPPNQPDYFSKKEDLIEEYRIHCFKGKSIRAGRKVQGVDGFTGQPHAWVRSLDGGWRISYDGFESTKAMRKIAANALKALDLDFGAVDIGKTKDNKLIVLEVNRAPGLEGNTVNVYAQAIQDWVNGAYEGVEERRAA